MTSDGVVCGRAIQPFFVYLSNLTGFLRSAALKHLPGREPSQPFSLCFKAMAASWLSDSWPYLFSLQVKPTRG